MLVQLHGQWSDNPTENTAVGFSDGEEAMPKVDATSPGGDIFISYHSNESGNYDVLLKKYDKEGYEIWDNPLVVSDNNQQSWLSDYAMKCDNEGNSIITFSDIRSGNPDIYLYKIGPTGEFLWGEDGIAFSTTPEAEYEPRLAVTSENNAITTFIHPDAVSGDELVINGVDEEGNYLFGEAGLIYTPEGDTFYSDPYAVPALDGNFIVVYSKNTGSSMYPNRYLKAMKFDAEGNELWNSEITVSDTGGLSGFTDLHVIPGISGGVVVAWHDDRDNDMHSSSFVQWIDGEGTPKYGDNGVEVATSSNVHRFDPGAVTLPDEEAIMVFWTQKNSSQGLAGLYGQYLSDAGERLWGNNGKVFHPLDDKFDYLWIARRQDATAAVVFYTEFMEGTAGQKLMSAAIDTAGSYVWPQEVVPVSTASSGVLHPDAGPLNNSQYILAWGDDRNSSQDIYAQNITTDGTLGMSGTGVSVQHEAKAELYPNPASSYVKISWGLEIDQITIWDLSGNVIKQYNHPSEQKFLYKPEQSGVYFVTFTGNKTTTTRKLVVAKK